MNKHINNLISQGENTNLDFKYELSDAKKIARTFSAFANTNGGKLLVGVKDNGTISGIHTDEEIYMVESAADLYCKPRVFFTFKTWSIEGKNILEIDIPESPNKPHLAPWKDNLWKAFIRINDENFLADAVQVQVWKNKRDQKSTLIKYKRLESFLLDFLRKNEEISLKKFCELAQIKRPVAKRVLINLVTIGVIKINTFENFSTYSLNNDTNF